MASHPLDHLVNRPVPYTRAEETDIRKTFARLAERRKQIPDDSTNWNECSEAAIQKIISHEVNK